MDGSDVTAGIEFAKVPILESSQSSMSMYAQNDNSDPVIFKSALPATGDCVGRDRSDLDDAGSWIPR